jgi:hypothetical protein
MSITFARLVAPMDVAPFLSECWTKKAVHLVDRGRTFDDVFGWDGLNALLNAGDLTFPKVKVSRNDHPVAPDRFTSDAGGQRIVNGGAVLDLFRDGASFGITAADTEWPPLRRVIECLYDQFLESVHTNVYCSPAHTQGFQCHFDLHEVFVLQVDGAKHWRVFQPTIQSPTESWKPEDAPDASVAPYLDVVLRKGDVLYVPRGHWHYAVAEDTPSLHVTAGITCHKAASFIDWLAGELADDPVWRRNLPLVGSAAPADGTFRLPADWSTLTRELASAIAARLDDPDLASRFCRAMLRDVQPLRRVNAPAQAASELEVEHLIFERPAGRRHFFTRSDEGVTLTSGECEIELEEAEAGFLQKLFATDAFTAEDIRRWRPSADPSEVADLLGELVRSGLLLVRPK